MTPGESNRRRRVVPLGNPVLPFLLGEGSHCAYEIFGDGFPPRARVVEARMSDDGDRVILLVESDSFDPVPDGEEYPEVVLVIKEYPKLVPVAEGIC